MILLEHRRGLGLPITVKPVDEVGERLGVADLLDGEDVGRKPVDHAGERGQLGLIGRLVTGTELAPRTKQVLQIPRADHDHRGLLRSPENAPAKPWRGDRRMPNAAPATLAPAARHCNARSRAPIRYGGY